MPQTDNTSKTLRIRNWKRFQHFRDRKPPWVKLYRDLLDDIEWHTLDPIAAKMLVMLWLIAAENDGDLPSIPELAFRLRLPEQRVISSISKLYHWLEHDDATPISGRYQSDSPETERETERETQEETEGNGANAPSGDRRQKAFRNYNAVAANLGLAKAEMLTKTRAQQIDARLKEVGLAGWNQALHNIEEMPFCRGENDRGWKVNLDWLLKPANLTKILEKQYQREDKCT